MMKKALAWFTSSDERMVAAAWVIIILITPTELAWLHSAFIKDDWSQLASVLTINFGFVAGALGMKTYHNIQIMKNDNSNDDDSSSAATSDATQNNANQNMPNQNNIINIPNQNNQITSSSPPKPEM